MHYSPLTLCRYVQSFLPYIFPTLSASYSTVGFPPLKGAYNFDDHSREAMTPHLDLPLCDVYQTSRVFHKTFIQE